MTSSINQQRLPSGSRPPFPAALVVLVLLVAVLSAPLLLGWVVEYGMRGTKKPVPPSEAARTVAGHLASWGLFGAVPQQDPEFTAFHDSIAHRITGINGFTESSGLHGDGTDWYEVEL